MRCIIDRFESDFVIIEIENGETLILSKRMFPPTIEIGDVLHCTPFGEFLIDTTSTISRRQEIELLANDLFEED